MGDDDENENGGIESRDVCVCVFVHRSGTEKEPMHQLNATERGDCGRGTTTKTTTMKKDERSRSRIVLSLVRDVTQEKRPCT